MSVTDASGNAITNTLSIANVNPIRYRGYFYDTETKLYYCNSRYYDPQMRRFINADEYVTTGQGCGGYNMFTYCLGNPVLFSDDSGSMAIYYSERNLGGGSFCLSHPSSAAGYGGMGITAPKAKSTIIPTISSNTDEFALYDNDRFEDKTPFYEKLFSGEITTPTVLNGDFGSAEITVWSSGWETDYIDVNLFKALTVGYSLTLDDGLGITASATLIETGVDFDIGSWNIDLSVGAGAGIDFYVGKKGITLSCKAVGLSIRW